MPVGGAPLGWPLGGGPMPEGGAPPVGGVPPGAVCALASSASDPAPMASTAATTPGIELRIFLFTLDLSHPSL